MAKVLFIDYKKCHGCGICEQFCATRQEEEAHSALARIWTIAWDLEGWGVPVACQHCQDPPCLAVCPKKAIYRDEELDRVMIDYEACIGCRMCVSACPFGAMAFDANLKRVVKCDLCGGNPVCVEMCNYGAIQYVEPGQRTTEVAESIRDMLGKDRFRRAPAKEPSQPGGVIGFAGPAEV
ncbi:MAG: 4Fe-4S dicluster domain-containing protein [Deltaproteobacteria bacterium]|nr:4Fe-4S dicluster domain-containing protein [Deltaproteobacteria bacterium]